MPLEGGCVCVCVTDVRNLTLKTLLSLFLNVLFPSSDLISFKKILLSKIPIQVGGSGKETLSLFPRWCREAGWVRSRLVLLQSREQSWISSRQPDPTATWCVPCGGVGGTNTPP